MDEVLTEWEAHTLFADRLGASDDCAVLPTPESGHLVVTTDMLHRDTDLPDGVTPYTVGWRVAAVNLSDLAGMAAEPEAMVVAAGLPEFERRYLEEFVDGVEDCCTAAGARYVGGDLDGHREETHVGTALGYADPPVRRDGAEPGARVCVTGALGRTAVSLEGFERGDVDRANEMFRFTPRVEEGLALSDTASSLTDVSDGVAVSLHQLADSSGVGFDVRSDALPLVDDASLEDVFVGGDYELLFTLPEDVEPEVGGAGFSEVGVVRERDSGRPKVTMDGEELEKRGYSHSD